MVARRLARALFRTLGQPAKAVALAQGVYAHVDKGAVTDVEQCELTHHLEMLGRIYLTDEVEGVGFGNPLAAADAHQLKTVFRRSVSRRSTFEPE